MLSQWLGEQCAVKLGRFEWLPGPPAGCGRVRGVGRGRGSGDWVSTVKKLERRDGWTAACEGGIGSVIIEGLHVRFCGRLAPVLREIEKINCFKCCVQ
jgi:hypothetical protein